MVLNERKYACSYLGIIVTTCLSGTISKILALDANDTSLFSAIMTFDQTNIVGEQSKPRISKYEFFQETQKYILLLCIFFNDRVFNAFFCLFRVILINSFDR